jgi:tRNA acetyltransferase TAN1
LVLIDDFDLLLSSARGNESEANYEARYLLGELGDKSATTDFTIVSGLTVAKTSLEPISTIARLRLILRKRPWEFRYLLKIKPISRVVSCDLQSIQAAAKSLVREIRATETFRVSLEKRRSEISSSDIVNTVASQIGRRVELRNPDKIVLVEIVGKIAGLSMIRPTEILSVAKEKRNQLSRLNSADRSMTRRFKTLVSVSPGNRAASTSLPSIP